MRESPTIVEPGPSRGASEGRPCKAILGAAAVLGRGAIGDWLTALIAVLGLLALVRFGIGNPLLVGIAACIEPAAFPLRHPAWVLAR